MTRVTSETDAVVRAAMTGRRSTLASRRSTGTDTLRSVSVGVGEYPVRPAVAPVEQISVGTEIPSVPTYSFSCEPTLRMLGELRVQL
ncbi:hypothetical protein D8S78_07375 [Natrialba swarupiae]|nr:hypothetical protein [Natrialba swarupiae]